MALSVRTSYPRLFLSFALGICALLLNPGAIAGGIEYTTTPGTGNQSFATKYPTYYSTYGCSSCHTTAPTLQVYGTAYKNAAVALGGRTQANVGPALTNIEQADSDGDGYRNIIEINALKKAYDATNSPTASVSLSTGQSAKSGAPGTTVGYSVTVTNNGNFTDSFTLGVSVFSGQSWTPSIVGTANNVAQAGTASITVNVAIPGGATSGQSSVARVTATSQGNVSISATPLNLTTSVLTTGPRSVSASIGSNTSDCRSSPCKTITYAMSQAATGSPGDAINVMQGIYNAALGEVFPITVKSGVQLYGISGAANTTIDATGANQRVFNSSSGNASTLIEGFTIMGALFQGLADGSNTTGGAINITGGSIKISRNVFSGNEARGYSGNVSGFSSGGQAYGGAIYVSGGTPTIVNNVFKSNIVRGGHGVDYFGTTTAGGGGGNGQGGAIYAIANGGTITNNTFYGNQAIGGSGGFSLGTGGDGGNGSYGAVSSSFANVVNNIFASNSATGGAGGGSSPSGSNGTGIVGALAYSDATATNNLFFANVGGSDFIGTNAVLGQDPQFVSPPSNLRIGLGSPAKGAGTPTGAPAIDFDAVTRPNPPSIGAFEAMGPDFVATDFNDDGRSDILWRNSSTGQVYRMFMNGFTRTGEALVYNEPNTAWTIIADADFNGDGVTDLLWRNATTGQVYLMPFNVSGMPNGGAVIYTEANAAWKIVHTPDVNGDDKADLLWWNSTTGQVYLMLMDGFTIGLQGMVYSEPNTAWRIVAVGDFAGSGYRNQLLWVNNTSGLVYLMTVSVAEGGFTQTGQVIYSSTPPYRVIAAADFDGDGKSDILWRKEDTGQIYLMLMNNGAITSEAQIYQEGNLAWKIVAVGDYNGNGKADILWRNDVTGQVYMMLMNGMSIADQAMVYQEGNTAWKILGPWEYRVP